MLDKDIMRHRLSRMWFSDGYVVTDERRGIGVGRNLSGVTSVYVVYLADYRKNSRNKEN